MVYKFRVAVESGSPALITYVAGNLHRGKLKAMSIVSCLIDRSGKLISRLMRRRLYGSLTTICHLRQLNALAIGTIFSCANVNGVSVGTLTKCRNMLQHRIAYDNRSLSSGTYFRFSERASRACGNAMFEVEECSAEEAAVIWCPASC